MMTLRSATKVSIHEAGKKPWVLLHSFDRARMNGRSPLVAEVKVNLRSSTVFRAQHKGRGSIMKFTPLLAGAMSGSMGGCVASHNKGGAYFRRRSVPTDPLSTFQSVVRGSLGGLSQLWVNTLTALQRTAWDNYALNVGWIDALGQSIQLSGLNHYVRANSPRAQNEFYLAAPFANFVATARIDAAPVIFDLGQQFVDGGSSVVGSGLIIVNSTPGYALADRLLVFASPPVNPTINFYKGPFLLAGSLVGNAASTGIALDDPAESPYASRYGSVPAASKLFWRVRFQKADGRLAAWTQGSAIAT